jgi:4-amino-4-deoxy-L-arabinose transferase-like glycosyltransferase
MQADAGRRVTWVAPALVAAVLAAASLHLAFFFFVAAARLVYPYELEWVEGGLADEVLAILRGQAPYAPPSIHRVAFIYPPLYFYLSAALAWVMGAGFLPLRLVSFAATAATFALIFALARRAGGGRAAGLLAAGLFAATFKIGGGWLDLARVDALFVALFLAGVCVLQRAKGSQGCVIAGALLALSFLTKQSALPMTLPLAAFAVYADRRRGWLLGASFAVVSLSASALFNWASQGWYGYYVFSGAASQPLAPGVWLIYWRQDLLAPLALTVLAGLGFIAIEWRARRPVGFWLALLAGTAGTAIWVQRHLGAVENNLLPVFAVLAVLGALGVERLAKLAARLPGLQSAGALAVIYGLLLLQLWRLAYNPLNYLPAGDNRQAGQALVQRLALVNGDVLVPEHGCVTWLAGKPTYAHRAAIEDVLNVGGPPADQLLNDMRAALRARRFAVIVVDSADFGQLFPELAQNYVVADNLPLSAAFYSVSGPRTLPEIVYVPNMTTRLRMTPRLRVMTPRF